MSSLLLLLFLVTPARACTDLLVTPGASFDGSSILAYNADSPTLYGSLYHYPQSSTSGSNTTTLRKVYNWDTGVYLGEIPEAPKTYNVVGNSNCQGLVIGESTFGGVALLADNQTGAMIDYGSLIYLTLQRARTAKEAITVMADLMDTYGYASGGESFSLLDPTGQVWMMEVQSRGSDYGKLGGVWVAMRIPDGSVAAHANQARITTFPRDDPENCRYAKDVVDVAVHYGLYPPDADPLDFSFSDVYDPINFVSVRQGEARVWSIFSKIADPLGSFQSQWQAYALGEDLSVRMPLYLTPYRKLTVLDVMELMNSHYEDTQLDSSVDVGAGLFQSPYRPRPLVWEHDDKKYHNERSIATPKTGWNFVAQVRPWMPPPLAALVWFGVDDSSTSPRTPVYGSIQKIPPAYAGKGSQDGVVTPLLEFDITKAFWVQQMVSNFCYGRWNDVYPVVRNKIDTIQQELLEKVAMIDQTALQLYKENPQDAIDHVTRFSVHTGQSLTKKWLGFYGELLVQFRDFYNITPKEDEPVCGCQATEIGMSDQVKQRIVEETGDHYKVLGDTSPSEHHVLFGEAGTTTATGR
jgi:dipeptidase